MTNSPQTFGPFQARISWIADEDPYDPDDAETWEYVERFGVFGCVIETRPPACACCGCANWTVAESLWSIVGDEAYHRQIERDLLAEIAA